MTYKEAIEILRSHNEWRRGAEIPMTDPKALGEAIDCVVEHFRDVTKMVGGIEERAKKYADEYAVGDAAIIVDLLHKVAEESYLAGATEQKKIDDAEFECKAESYETGFAQGQEVGEREMIGKACKWLFNHLGKDNGTPYFIKAFRKAMED